MFEVAKLELGAWFINPEGFLCVKIENGPWFNPLNSAAHAGKIDLAPWLNPPAGMDSPKIELGAWLIAGAAGRRRRQHKVFCY